MTKAIIFDCFGVLATEAWLPFKAKHFGHDPDLMDQVNHISWQADRGLISRREAIAATAELAHITPAEFSQAINRNVPNEALFDYIRQLKQKYKIGLLSNVSDDYFQEIFTKEQLGLFDAISMSFKNGHIKPEPQAFEIIAEELGVAISECVFIDDNERNIVGAKATGGRAVLYKDFEQLKPELEKLL